MNTPISNNNVTRTPSDDASVSSHETQKAGNLSSTTKKVTAKKQNPTSTTQSVHKEATASNAGKSGAASKKYSPIGLIGLAVGGLLGGAAGAVYSLPRNFVRVANGKPIKSMPEHIASKAQAGAKFFGKIDTLAFGAVKTLVTFLGNSKSQSLQPTTTKSSTDSQISELKSKIAENKEKISTLIDTLNNLDMDVPSDERSADIANFKSEIEVHKHEIEDLKSQIKSLEYIKSNNLDYPTSVKSNTTSPSTGAPDSPPPPSYEQAMKMKQDLQDFEEQKAYLFDGANPQESDNTSNIKKQKG
jgi:hypothetical protein